MNKYHLVTFKATDNRWACEIFHEDETLACYGGIDTEKDALLVGEAFIDGIQMIEGE